MRQTNSLFHIFRNSPMGRENLLQSAYFCKQVKSMALTVYLPRSTQGLMYFDSGPVTLDLDSSYTRYQDTARQRVQALTRDLEIDCRFFEPTTYTARLLADLPIHWSCMVCPRVISDQSSRIGLGHIGPKVRHIVKHACFPVVIPAMCYKPWSSVSVFFGGSELGLQAVKHAWRIAELADVPLTVYSQLDHTELDHCRKMLESNGFVQRDEASARRWVVFESGSLEDNLYQVPYDSFVVVGAAGVSLMRELVFGSKLELIQSILPNPIMVVGPNSVLRY